MTTLYDAEGNEVEMPSQEEITELKAKAEKAGDAPRLAEMEKGIRETLGIDEKADLIEAVKLSKESANPNWAATRNKLTKMTEFIKAGNPKADIGEDGTVNVEEKIDINAIEQKATSAALKVVYGQEIDKGFNSLTQYTKEEKAVIRKSFDKLSAGEELNSETIPGFIAAAVGASFPKKASNPHFEGGAPRIQSSGENFAETAEGKDAANTLFGDESFAKEKE